MISKPVFNSVPNQKHEMNGLQVWQSRSVVVIACIASSDRVLLAKRGQDLESGAGMWSFPCGFLDYNENGLNGARREVWEELGLDISQFCMPDVSPFHVHTEPTSKQQNVTLSYMFSLSVDQEESVIEQIKKNGIVPNREIEEVRFVSWEKLPTYDLAFHHEKISQMVQLEKLMEKM